MKKLSQKSKVFQSNIKVNVHIVTNVIKINILKKSWNIIKNNVTKKFLKTLKSRTQSPTFLLERKTNAKPSIKSHTIQ